MDILAALNQHSPQLGTNPCKVQLFLNGIPEDTPGRADLMGAVADAQAYPAARLTLTFSALGAPVSAGLISDHRAKRCRCFR